jgi:Family of unknown function (DUF5715)
VDFSNADSPGATPSSSHPAVGSGEADTAAYRAAVAEVADEVAAEVAAAQSHGPAAAEAVLSRHLGQPEIDDVLARTPGGADGATAALLVDLRRFTPNPRSSATDLAAMVRVFLLSQIDAMWWGGVEAFRTDDELRGCADLVELDGLRRDGRLAFDYRRQPRTLPSRAMAAAARRAAPGRTPRTAGIRLTLARPETVALLNQCAAEFRKNAPAGTRRLWVNSLTRSVVQQTHLRSLGYAAVLSSAHCTGFAADVEMAWFRRTGGHVALQQVLLGRLADGDLNLIDEGQAWHVCVSPQAAGALRRAFEHGLEG